MLDHQLQKAYGDNDSKKVVALLELKEELVELIESGGLKLFDDYHVEPDEYDRLGEYEWSKRLSGRLRDEATSERKERLAKMGVEI